MEGQRGGEESYPADIQDWELELATKVAAAFRTTEREELEAELFRKLLELKRRRPPGIRDWKAYLAKFLYNKASNLVRAWRARQRREADSGLYPESATPAPSSERSQSGEPADYDLAFSRLQGLDEESLHLMHQLLESGVNQSRLARRLGLHRNTIRQRIQRIKRALAGCPSDFVSSQTAAVPKRPNATGRSLTAHERTELKRQADSRTCPLRERFRARLILALANGLSYRVVADMLRTTAPTISRWKRRFDQSGLAGLKPAHKGSAPRAITQVLRAKVLKRAQQGCRRVLFVPGHRARTGDKQIHGAADTGYRSASFLNPSCHLCSSSSCCAYMCRGGRMGLDQRDRFVRVSTTLLEALLKLDLTGVQWRIVLWTIRNTLGWNRESTRFSWYRIAKELGLDRSGVVRAGKRLLERSVLVVQEDRLAIRPDPPVPAPNAPATSVDAGPRTVTAVHDDGKHRKRGLPASVFRRAKERGKDMYTRQSGIHRRQNSTHTSAHKDHPAGAAMPVPGKYDDVSEA